MNTSAELVNKKRFQSCIVGDRENYQFDRRRHTDKMREDIIPSHTHTHTHLPEESNVQEYLEINGNIYFLLKRFKYLILTQEENMYRYKASKQAIPVQA